MVRYPAGRRDTRPELGPALLSKNRFEWTGCQGALPTTFVPDPAKGSRMSAPGREYAPMSGSIAITGFCVGCKRLPL